MMGDYCCVRVWQLKASASESDLEAFAGSSLLEMQRWIPGIKRLALCRLAGEPKRYMMLLVFTDYEAYGYWRQIEEEASTYWERYAAVLVQWEQLSNLVGEYPGELLMDMGME
jgi:hypothetical protein